MKFYREVPDPIVESVGLEDIERMLDALRYIRGDVQETPCHCPYVKWTKSDAEVMIPYGREPKDIYAPAVKLADWIYRVQEVIRDVSYNEGLDEVCIWNMVKNGVYRDKMSSLKTCWTQEDRDEMHEWDKARYDNLRSDLKMVAEMFEAQKRVQELPPHDYKKKVKE